jgi:hypothetical protein
MEASACRAGDKQGRAGQGRAGQCAIQCSAVLVQCSARGERPKRGLHQRRRSHASHRAHDMRGSLGCLSCPVLSSALFPSLSFRPPAAMHVRGSEHAPQSFGRRGGGLEGERNMLRDPRVPRLSVVAADPSPFPFPSAQRCRWDRPPFLVIDAAAVDRTRTRAPVRRGRIACLLLIPFTERLPVESPLPSELTSQNGTGRDGTGHTTRTALRTATGAREGRAYRLRAATVLSSVFAPPCAFLLRSFRFASLALADGWVVCHPARRHGANKQPLSADAKHLSPARLQALQ